MLVFLRTFGGGIVILVPWCSVLFSWWHRCTLFIHSLSPLCMLNHCSYGLCFQVHCKCWLPWWCDAVPDVFIAVRFLCSHCRAFYWTCVCVGKRGGRGGKGGVGGAGGLGGGARWRESCESLLFIFSCTPVSFLFRIKICTVLRFLMDIWIHVCIGVKTSIFYRFSYWRFGLFVFFLLCMTTILWHVFSILQTFLSLPPWWCEICFDWRARWTY